jgi:hypothetical protein
MCYDILKLQEITKYYINFFNNDDNAEEIYPWKGVARSLINRITPNEVSQAANHLQSSPIDRSL